MSTQPTGTTRDRYERLAYAEADSARQMHDDCTACGYDVAVPGRRYVAAGLLAEDPPARVGGYTITEETATLAGRLHLHLD